MKLFTTILCTLAFAFAGFSLATAEKNHNESVAKHQTLMAATLPDYGKVLSNLPLDVQLDLNKKTKPEKEYVPYEVIVVKDTTSAPKVINPVHKKKRTSARATVKRQGLGTPAIIPDSTVKNKVCGDREEHTPDSVGPPKGSICLIVDGEVVYKR